MDAVGVVNQSLQMIASQTQIVSLTDPTPAAKAALVLYEPTVILVLRQLDPDFARRIAPLSASLLVTPPPPWIYGYTYPIDCIRLRQLMPSPGTYNIFDPLIIRGSVNVGIAQPGNVPVKIIATNLANALGVYTTAFVTESEWDTIFEQAVVRQLANPLAMALSGRPDFAKELLEQAARYEQMQELVDESMARSI